jgi:hypothetical protein
MTVSKTADLKNTNDFGLCRTAMDEREKDCSSWCLKEENERCYTSKKDSTPTQCVLLSYDKCGRVRLPPTLKHKSKYFH